MVAAATGVGTGELSGGESCLPRVGDLPIRAVPVIAAHLSMAAARKVAALKRAGRLFVERDGQLVGALDEQALAGAPDDAPVVATMRPIDLFLHLTTPATRARELFIRARTDALPVAAGAFLVGAVWRADVERALRDRRRPLAHSAAPVRAVA
jgi:CBS domain-containing protein